MTRLTGKTALVTGASRGIGRAIALRLAADGATVAVHYARNDEAAGQTLREIQQAGGQAFVVRAELGAENDIHTLFTALERGLTGRPLDILVNNAATRSAGPMAKTTPEDFDLMYAINVKAPFFITQRALALIPDGGRIINISSAVTRIALPEPAYAMTKGAIDAFSHTLAQDVGARGITVNTVAPFPTATEPGPCPESETWTAAANALNPAGRPSDVADIVGFLASDDARWITGQILDATGGRFLGRRLPG